MKILRLVIAFIIIGTIGVFVISSVSYLDPITPCYIKLNGHITAGNEKTIREAIKNIKDSDPETYMALCRHITTITEVRCSPTDPKVDPIAYKNASDGCYINGSKTIYLIPDKSSSNETVKHRQELIKKYSLIAKETQRLQQ